MPRDLDFVIIGAQKAGTTSLYRYLRRQPGLYLPEAKDFYLFNDDPTYGVSPRQLPTFLGQRGQEARVGVANVAIFPFPEVVDAMHSWDPDLKLVLSLRDPVDRAYSSYWMMRSNGREPCASFEDAIAEERTRLRSGDFRVRVGMAYLHHGFYARHLSHLWGRFSPGQTFICLADELQADPRAQVMDLCSWLGVQGEPSRGFEDRHHVASMPRSMALQRLLRGQGRIKQLYRRAMPTRLRLAVDRHVVAPLEARNLKPQQYPPMAPATRARLRDLYRPDVTRLETLIGRDLSHWK